MRRKIALSLIFVMAVLTLIPSVSLGRTADPLRASATLVNPSGETVGFARFYEPRFGGTLVLVNTTALSPGLHGMHVHTTGACSPDFAAAGGHFNPTGDKHGAHAGDLGNIFASPAGQASAVTYSTHFTLSPGELSLFDADGSALVVHAGEDDLVTDPAGNSGARIACGVIHPVENPS